MGRKAVGTAAEAKIASGLSRYGTILPEGWRNLGSGSTRTAYLSPSGVVYKVGRERNNKVEAEAIESFYKQGKAEDENYYIPKAAMFACGVLAMERVEGKKRGGGDSWSVQEERGSAALSALGIADVGRHNYVIMEDGRVGCYDIGYMRDINW